MGQDHSALSAQATQQLFQRAFQRDPRLVEQVLFIPELFSGPIDADIKLVEKLKDSLPSNELQSEIFDGIDDRFGITGEEHLAAKPAQNNSNQIAYELASIDRFCELLKRLQLLYYVGQKLKSILTDGEVGKKMTVRKRVHPEYVSTLGKDLYARGYLHYYLILLKRYLISKDERKRKLVNDFHQNIGKMICQMIEYQHLSQEKTLQLFFSMVIIEKMPQAGNLERELASIREEFWPIYLKKEHSLIVEPAQYEQFRQVARCYLDELYLRSIKEAQDPDIIVEPNEGLGIMRNFPILRVKEKHK